MNWRIGAGIVALAACVDFCAAQDATSNKSDSKAIVGKWKITHFEEQADVHPAAKFKSLLYVFGEVTVAITRDDKTFSEGVLKLDPTKSPKHLDMISSSERQVGIYKLEGDKLTICIGAFKDATERPVEFKAGKDSRLMLIEFERIKR